MSKDISREDKMRDAFLILGSQYFAHARYSTQIFYLPVSVTLFHHAIEMLLKGYLSKTNSSSELKSIGHNLVDLWEKFKEQVGDTRLSQYDGAISKLDKLEILRYPDAIVDDGFVLNVSLGKPSSPIAFPGMEKLPRYSINISDMDSIATKVFAACEVAPQLYFRGAPMEFLNALPPTFSHST